MEDPRAEGGLAAGTGKGEEGPPPGRCPSADRAFYGHSSTEDNRGRSGIFRETEKRRLVDQ